MNLPRICLAACLLWAVGSASAGVTPIPEFTGTMFEGFEDLYPPGGYPAPFPVFEEQGTFDDIVAHYCMIAVSLYSVPQDTYIYPYDGNLMGGSVTGWAAFEFTTPVTEFGGYIGTADRLSGGSVTFKDASGQVIDTVPLTIELGQWGWHGWSSDVPISRVEILGSDTIGLPTVFDDMRATVPEPATLTLLVAGAVLALAGRR
jgi:hypothetical protein